MNQTEQIIYHPIGIIHSEHTEQENTPIQGIFNPSKGFIELFSDYVPGLETLEDFSHIILLYHFHQSSGSELIREPFLDGETKRGIFSIRHFNRPNSIGFSIVDLLGIHENIIKIGAVDILDGTPLLDIKPYVYRFDHREEVSDGWVEKNHLDDIADWNATPKGLRDRSRAKK